MEKREKLRKDQEKLEKAIESVLRWFRIATLGLLACLVFGVVFGTRYFSTFDANALSVFHVAFYIGAVMLVATMVLGALLHSLDHTVREVKRELAKPLSMGSETVDPLVV